ncbi:MAG: fatty acid desaturase family protein [Planctomycetota bacterium]|jgi:fatty acid desaturase
MGAAAGPYDFTRTRKEMVQALGKDRIVALHRQSKWIDALGIIGLYGLFAFNVWYLGTQSRSEPGIGAVIWWILFVLQGCVIMSFGYLLHDVCVHRSYGGRRFSYWLSVVSGVLSFQPPSQYGHTHLDHHNYTGTDEDEAYKQDVDTRFRRILFLTPIGYFAAIWRFLRRNFPPKWPAPDSAFGRHPNKALLVREYIIIAVCYVLIFFAWRTWKSPVQYGFLLPAFFVLPVANTLRTILEHAETNVENNYHCATYYRTGPLTRPLLFWDAGDCHLVHHVFPGIPWYHMGEACDTLRPFLIEHGVRERRSILELLKGYFVDVQPHRTLWPTAKAEG